MQAHFLLAGTLEGSLHLWDLREDSSLHKDRSAFVAFVLSRFHARHTAGRTQSWLLLALAAVGLCLHCITLLIASVVCLPCRDALDLRISRGIRKPCYSTSLPFLSLLGGSGGSAGSAQDNADEEFQHSAPVVAVEALSPFAQHPLGSAGGGGSAGAGSVVSQFVSIDEAGLVIFWVTSEKGLSFLDAGTAQE
jgi:hypothetical protein